MDRYEILVAGHLDARRARALGCEDLRLLPESASLLVFMASDQAALYGLLARLRNAGLELIAVDRVLAPVAVPRGAWTVAPSQDAADGSDPSTAAQGRDSKPQERRERTEMSDSTIKLVIAAALALHGFGHGGALGALAWIAARPGSDIGGWHAARSWLLPSLPAETATLLASVAWVLSLVGFVAAALGFWGILVPGEVWRPLAVVAAVISTAGIVLFIGTWPTFNTLAALGMNVAVLVALLAMRWPSETMFGR